MEDHTARGSGLAHIHYIVIFVSVDIVEINILKGGCKNYV